MRNILDKYNARADKANSLLCVGLDSELEKLPEKFKSLESPQFEFNKFIIEQTHEYVAAYKPNIAFYESRGEQGLRELKLTMDYLRERYPDIMNICDAKRADIGNTNRGYVAGIYDWLGFDAMTIQPYLGKEAVVPFLERDDKANIILCRTSNPGAGEFQDLESGGKPLWQIVAEQVSQDWNSLDNCMLVVGATYPEEMKKIRQIAPDMTFLVPGIGAQGGSVDEAVSAGLDAQGRGLIINSARSIIFADNPKLAAQQTRDEINAARAKYHVAN
jgi:orotidine-5'-phosphate decarboxylase